MPRHLIGIGIQQKILGGHASILKRVPLKAMLLTIISHVK